LLSPLAALTCQWFRHKANEPNRCPVMSSEAAQFLRPVYAPRVRAQGLLIQSMRRAHEIGQRT
jgi:hypothetical protein